MASFNLFNHTGNKTRIMLPIAIHLNVDVVSVFFSVLMAGLYSTSNAKILRKIEYIKMVSATNLKRVIS